MAQAFRVGRSFTGELAAVLGLADKPVREIVLRSTHKDAVTVDVSLFVTADQAAGLLSVIERYELRKGVDGR